MRFEYDEDFRPENYVTPEEFKERYPGGAVGALCRLCGRMLLLRPEDELDCGMHLN